MSYSVDIREIMLSWENVIKRRYQLSDYDYNSITFELAMKFLDRNFANYPAIKQQVQSSKSFWGWWKTQMYVVNAECGLPGHTFEQWMALQLKEDITIPKAIYMEIIEKERSKEHEKA